jgi:DNA-binding response OmpR family regulator
MKRQTVLIVDDEATVREVVRRYLELEGFKVLEAASGPLALQVLHDEQPDLIVLDIMLPGLDGFTFTRSVRNPVRGEPSNKGIPIIMLTARTEEADRIAGFELGADDYVVKPFSPRELVMRIKAVLRRSISTDSGPGEIFAGGEVTTLGDLRLEGASREVWKDKKRISLTAKEFDLLWFLAQHPEQVFTRAQLLDQVWDYGFYGDESTVTVHIHRLREKIEDDPSQPNYIQTVWGVGYKLEVPP